MCVSCTSHRSEWEPSIPSPRMPHTICGGRSQLAIAWYSRTCTATQTHLQHMLIERGTSRGTPNVQGPLEGVRGGETKQCRGSGPRKSQHANLGTRHCTYGDGRRDFAGCGIFYSQSPQHDTTALHPHTAGTLVSSLNPSVVRWLSHSPAVRAPWSRRCHERLEAGHVGEEDTAQHIRCLCQWLPGAEELICDTHTHRSGWVPT